MPDVVGFMMHWMFLAQVSGLGGWMQSATAAPVPPAPSAIVQTTGAQPASLPITTGEIPAATATDAPDSRPTFASFRDTTFGQLFQGKKTLTPGEAVQLQFWLDALKDLVFTAITFIPRLIVAFIFFAVFYGLYRAVRRVVLGSLSKAHIDPSVRDMLTAVLKWGIVGFGAIIACNQVGIQITGLLAGTAIIGLAIGFAAQETLANFIAGVVIFWDRPFKVGDYIDVDSRYGKVLRITFRSTRVLNGDGEVIVVPNTMMLASKMTNHSTNPVCRVKVTVRIPYSASIEMARSILESIAADDVRIGTDPAPSVWVAACGDDGVHLTLGFWVEDESIQKGLEAEYLEKAKKALDAAGMPMPIRHIQLLSEPAQINQLRRAG